MTTRNAADRYLKFRNGKWQYYRRVPKEFAEHDNRGTIRVSLKTDSLTLARSKRDALAEADEQLWMTLASAKGSIARLLDPATSQILKRYEAARHRAMTKGFIYTPADQLAETANLEEIVSRLIEVAKQPENEKREAEALLGGVNRPKIPVSKAFEIYCEKIALSDTVMKSPAQIKAWRKAKKRAVNNFIKICGDARPKTYHVLHLLTHAYYKMSDNNISRKTFCNMLETLTELEQIEKFMQTRYIVRAKDLRAIGISGTAISRARDEGILIRLSRGLYTRPDANMDTHFQLAEISKRYPHGVICLVSALSFYGVTDQLPTQIWMAIKKDGRKPKSGFPKIRSVRFREPYYSEDIIHHSISEVNVPMYTLEKTLADAFRNPKLLTALSP